jgi:hypothetical protein
LARKKGDGFRETFQAVTLTYEEGSDGTMEVL